MVSNGFVKWCTCIEMESVWFVKSCTLCGVYWICKIVYNQKSITDNENTIKL